MKDLRSDEWRNAIAREFQEQSLAAEKIGQQLQVKLAKIVTEPLPAALQLFACRCRKLNPSILMMQSTENWR